MRALPAPIPQRTLQYRLKRLVSDGRLIMEGEGRWAKCRLADILSTALPSGQDKPSPLPFPRRQNQRANTSDRYLQPFDDVNKRVSRLAANVPLIKANLAPLSFADVPRQAYTEAVLGVYELNKLIS